MNKSYVLLCLCDELKKGKEICIENCCNEYGISIPTFRRYLAVLRDFFWEKEQREIVYESVRKVYILK